MVRAPLLARRTAALAVVAAAVAATFAAPAHAEPLDAEAASAAAWLAGEVDPTTGGVPGMIGTPDWGLTVDALIGLEAAGGDQRTIDLITETLKVHVRDYNSLDAWSEPGQRIAGATAKLLYAAVITGSDPEAFGEYDLRRETLDLIAGPELGPEHGRVKDEVFAPSVDGSNTFAQSLAVAGLARSGGVPQEAVDFLLDQQCSSGGFRLYPYAFGGGTVGGDCDSQGGSAVLDPDSTAMAVQALLSAAAHDSSAGAAEGAALGAEWLLGIQHDDGSFGGSGPTAAPNTNSTGLAGQALAATGHDEAAAEAAAWVAAHQITADDAGAASAEAGTIAYNGDSLAAARAEGIPVFQRDQWRRATAQAMLALSRVSLGDIGTVDPGPGTDPGDGDPPGDLSGPPKDSAAGPPRGTLPVTGSPVATVFGTGAALLVLGVVTLYITRREETTR
ncbi:prenyltransferase/squalene oxidase-like repeat protein [Stackebrandtia albiflava]|uniref:Prenyltransferase/squalene oxidase-like repeat protein n=1 Tax=Stackebrandtia albiflava TaxID=406432 RepID=A0A562VEN2_9ACTN|nr:prenyltransferase/squalene oxidase repeat-containing protein [Stackebrandtia albiflava]TWJ16325.1 prenyltransferase/squalene oxidase-like repeat protein [Stackebrandtia albiflava]